MLRVRIGTLFLLWALSGTAAVRCADSLHIVLTDQGVKSLTYRGVEYVDPSGAGVLGFTGGLTNGNVWAPCVVDASKSKAPFSTTPTASVLKGSIVTQTYPWGTLAANYTIKGDDLYITTRLTNTSNTTIGWWKANLLQLNNRLVFDKEPWDKVMPFGYTPTMHWDYHWSMWGGPSDPYDVWNFSDPHVYWWVDSAAPFQNQRVMILFADLDPKWQTGVYHEKTDQGDAWPVDAASKGDPGGVQRIPPGTTDLAHMVLRFRSGQPDDIAVVEKNAALLKALQEKVNAAQTRVDKDTNDPDIAPADGNADQQTLNTLKSALAKETAVAATAGRGSMPSPIEIGADGYEAFGRAYPRTVTWTDRRPIGTYFGCRGNGQSATNPNGWFGDPTVDTTTPEGRVAFATRLLADMDNCVKVLTETGAQGMVWWDVEGARWPQPTTYIGDPRVLDPANPMHDKFAPELDTPVTYDGKQMPVIDACFKKLHDAGFKTGLTIRPTQIAWNGKAAQQTNPPGVDPSDILVDKATYARERWGCTIFYIDSISDWFGNFIMEKLVAKYPDVLLMPEWGRTRSYRHSSPFSYTRFTGFYHGAPAVMQACWPDAFCCMSNVDYNTDYNGALYGVKHGNLLLFNCWYLSDEAKAIKKIYEATGVKHIPFAADQKVSLAAGTVARIALKATDEDGNKVTYSIMGPPTHGALGTLDPATGTVTYKADPGYSGSDCFTFMATDSTGLNSNRGMVTIAVWPVSER